MIPKKRGHRGAPAGESHHRAKLTEETVASLRALHQKGVCIRCAVNLLEIPVSYGSAWDAINYQTWKHVR